ncbi:MAG: class I SAM-dependent methyltransferase [Bacteroidetes bacterium]|nr:MAG: class I SAM-dependent methyltransferase [Bacteroidota bacterium]
MKLRWKIAQAAELRWWKNYLRRQPVDDYLTAKKEYWLRVMQQLGVFPEAGETILDAGSGPAGIFIVFDHQKVVAVDPLLDRYTDQLSHFNPEIYPNVNFISETLENFTAEKKFNYVFCLNAINHVADINLSLDNLFSLLAPGGKLIISSDAHRHNWLKPIFKLIPGDILHPHQYDLKEYRDMLLERGGKIQKEICLKKGKIFDYWIWVIRHDN